LISEGILEMEDRGYWRHERIAFLALATLKGVGFRTLYKVAQSGISFTSALRRPDEAGLGNLFAESGYSFESQKELWEAGLAEAKKLAALNVSLLFKGEARFPEKLAQISDAPQWLFVQGAIENLYMPAMSIVGTRKPSEDGILITRILVMALAGANCVTVSGLALGIDQTAHVESMKYGIPTVAVLGTGIAENYPRGSEGLREEIISKGGTVVSEYLPSQSYSAENFVRRNRLQAALGDILFPTEWKIKSGTAHTVNFAHKYGKKIINLYLPMSKDLKPELEFSAAAYGAISLEIPKEFSLLTGLISVLTEPAQVSLSDPPEHLAPDMTGRFLGSDSPSDSNINNDAEVVGDGSDPQLQLL
jgi:DNA processing protein